ncbi:DoxX family protein [Ignavibacteria bacterium]|jgi:putative oxidoreductase|nr:DoxX family protein [Bacteroidota bacterium]MCZ2133371.1 DoxX family protein [Bacteroidota bacterium]
MIKKIWSNEVFSTDLGSLILRVGLGGTLFGNHGLVKLSRIGQDNIQFLQFMGLDAHTSMLLAGIAESVFGIFLALGIRTRLSALPLIFVLSIAVFVQHAADPFRVKELAVIYLTGLIALFFVGGGKYSVDGWLDSRRS